MKSYQVATNTITNKDERMPVGVDIKELDALLEAGLVRIVPEFDGKTIATSTYNREDILSFLVNRPDQSHTHSIEAAPDPATLSLGGEPTASGRRGC